MPDGSAQFPAPNMLETRGARLRYSDTGRGEPTFVFLHYWGGSARTWGRVIPLLETDTRCVALDARGWGGSQALDGRYDLAAMADDVRALVTALDLGTFVLVGHSMGGKVAQMVAASASGAAAMPAGLVLVAPAPPTAMTVPPEARAAMLRSYQSREGVEYAISILAGCNLTEAEREQVIVDTLAGHPAAKCEWTERGMIETVDESLRSFGGPVAIVVGDDDRVERFDALQVAFAGVLQSVVFKCLPGVGHLSPIEDPEAIASMCRTVARRIGFQ